MIFFLQLQEQVINRGRIVNNTMNLFKVHTFEIILTIDLVADVIPLFLGTMPDAALFQGIMLGTIF